MWAQYANYLKETHRRASRGRETLWVTLRTAAVSNSFQTDALTEEPSNHLDNRWLTVLLQEPLIESLSQPQNILHGLDGLFIPFQRCHNHICVIDWKLRTKNDPWMCIAGVNRYYTDVFFLIGLIKCCHFGCVEMLIFSWKSE